MTKRPKQNVIHMLQGASRMTIVSRRTNYSRRHFRARKRLGSFDRDHALLRNDQEKVGSDFYKAIHSLEKKRVKSSNGTIQQ